MKETYKFPSINQFKNVIKDVQYRTYYVGDDDNGQPMYDKTLPLPTINYRGSVKLHGTNASIVYVWDPIEFNYVVQLQSRTRVISVDDDNAGFAKFCGGIDMEVFLGLITKNSILDYTPETIRVYGEWCGGNIQKGVGLNQLDKMFVVFSIKIDDIWLDDDILSTIKMPESRIYNILDYKTYNITIDFNNLDDAAVKMAELTNEVENECPVSAEMGINNGCGEGIVWVTHDKAWLESRFWFKTKGDKHKVSGNDRNKISISTEKLDSINQLVENVLPEGRLLQGIDYLKENNLEVSRKNLGTYLKWINQDIIKEELDTITENGFSAKEVSKFFSNKARKWFFENELKLM